jgi:hypothetical protein
MKPDLLTIEADYASRFLHQRILMRNSGWRAESLHEQYEQPWDNYEARTIALTAADRLRHGITVLNENESLFLQTNSYGLIGPEIDGAKKLVGIWGDSVVQGWGEGWIGGLSDYFPNFQILNGGLQSVMISAVAMRAIEMNRRLPIQYNVIFPGLNTIRLPQWRQSFLSSWLHRLCNTLPNVILCTQPTSLNEDVIADDFAAHIAAAGTLGYRAGYILWKDVEPTSANIAKWFHFVLEQNEVVRRVAAEQHTLFGRRIPVVDVYRLFYTRGTMDFRDHFVDAGHFRVEAYPYVREVFQSAFSDLLK